ncbi:MAG: amino acid racemase [Candidatus Aenigmarchaeota archaeon]|nr:amino acid racemase [Candidatus Aenigmarchaeota archaeon]
MANKKIVGILGGMGPEATADLYMRIIRIFQTKYNAKFDSDYPQIIINSIPLPDVVEAEKIDGVYTYLANGIKTLEAAGVDFIVIDCNTVQFLVPSLREDVTIPIIGIPEETLKVAKSYGFNNVGLLATKNTIKMKAFEKEAARFGMAILVPGPEQQNVITDIIMNVLSGNRFEQDKSALRQIIKELESRGAEAIIVGCTDLPLIINNNDSKVLLLDTTEVLAQACIREAFGD